MSRIPIVDPDQMTDRQREVASKMIAGPRGHAGSLMGLWLHSPDLADRTQAVGEYLRFKGTIPAKLREFIILIIAREWRCYHEWIVHAPLAKKEGLSAEVIEALRDRRTPTMDTSERIIFDFTSQMLRSHRVSKSVFEDTRSLIGVDGIIELSVLIGHYINGAATLNVAEYDLPDGTPAPFFD